MKKLLLVFLVLLFVPFYLSGVENKFTISGTKIYFSLANPGHTTIGVFNIKGEKVKGLMDGNLDADKDYTAIWDGRDNSGKTVSSGVYFYKMRVGKFVSTKKMILMK